jgi:hypothetical protein
MLDKNVAKAIISSLSAGTVPVQYVQYYDVGRQQQKGTVEKEIETNSSKLRFVNGDYGTGKTHFLATIRHRAIENDYVPTHVVLSPRGTPLHDLAAVYSRIVKNLVVDEQDKISPMESVLEFLFEVFQNWLKNYVNGKRSRCEKCGIEQLYCHHCHSTGKIEELYIKDFRKLDVNLQIAIVVYRTARWGFNPDFQTADLVIRWLEGEPLYRRELNYLGIWENLSRGDILRGLNEIAKLISLVGKKRMIIMLDEAEGIENLMPYQRPIACENLQFLIEGVHEIENIYFLYATTPTFFNDVESYSRDLKKIVRTTACTDLVPLTANEIQNLAFKIAEIYMASLEPLDDVPGEELIRKKLIECCTRDLKKGPSVRAIITDLISKFHKIISAL